MGPPKLIAQPLLDAMGQAPLPKPALSLLQDGSAAVPVALESSWTAGQAAMRAYRLPQTPAQRPGRHSHCLSCSPKLQGKESNSFYQKRSPLFVWMPPTLISCADLHAMSMASPSHPSSGEAPAHVYSPWALPLCSPSAATPR